VADVVKRSSSSCVQEILKYQVTVKIIKIGSNLCIQKNCACRCPLLDVQADGIL